MKILVDMNLSPNWIPFLAGNEIEATHWSSIGAKNATDADIMHFARTNGWTVLTHDLDFGILLAHSSESGPSVVQFRVQDVDPIRLGPLAVSVLLKCKDALESGAIVTVLPNKTKVRILPISRNQ